MDALPIGANIRVRHPDGSVKYYHIEAREPFRLVKVLKSTLNAGEETGFQTITELEPSVNALYHVTMYFDENCKLKIKHPSGSARFGTRRAPEAGVIEAETNKKMFSIFTARNVIPDVNLINNAPCKTKAVIVFEGFRYIIKEITPPKQYINIQIGGVTEATG